jgi:hypothetical protein
VSRLSKALIAGILVYPVLLVIQGLDFTDQGYWASIYASTFTHPGDLRAAFTCWLADFIGAIFLSGFGFLGLASLRLGYLVVLYATVFLAYRIVRRVTDVRPEAILGALLIGLPFATWDEQGSMVWVGYNDLTGLLFIWAVYHIVRWAQDRDRRQLVLSGALLGANVFVRLPNGVGAILAVAVVFYGVITKRRKVDIIVDAVVMATGFLAGVGTCLLVIAVLGHFPDYLGGLRDVLGAKVDKETHGFDKLVKAPLRDNIGTVLVGLYVLGLVAVLLAIGKRLQRMRRTWLVGLVAVLLGVALAVRPIPVISNLARRLTRGGLWSYAGVAYLLLAAAAFLPVPRLREFPVRRLTAFAALLVLVVLPIGSERSLMNAHYAMWLPIAGIGTYLLSMKPGDQSWMFVKIASSLVVILTGIIGSWTTPFRDLHDRTKLVHIIHNPKLRLIPTTQERARVVQEFLDAAPRYLKPGDFSVAFDYTPMLQYLTDTRPYLYNPNPMYYSVDSFDEALARAEGSDVPLPVVFEAKGPMNDDWPNDVSLGPAANLRKFVAERMHFEAFKSRHGYGKVWENGYFEIWKPGQVVRPNNNTPLPPSNI